MLVVDSYTLQTINVLNLVDDVLLNSGWTEDVEDIVRGNSAIRQWVASTNVVMLLNEYLTVQWDEILALVTILASHYDLTVTTLDLAEGNLAIDLSNDCWIRWVTSLEELGYTWKTTGNIAGLAAGTVYLYDDGTWLHLLLVVDHNVSTDRQGIASEHLVLSVDNMYDWSDSTVLRLSYDLILETCIAVGLNLEGITLDDFLITHVTSLFADDDGVEWVPLSNDIALLDYSTALKEELRTVTDGSSSKGQTCVDILDTHFGHTAYYNLNG